MFTTVGIVVALNTVYAAMTGEVYAKSGARGRRVSRQTSPEYFWVVIVIYGGVSVALIMVF